MAKGTVKRFNEFRGWGFITGEDKKDYFVHYKSIEGAGYKKLIPGEIVEFEPVETYQGLQAHNVTECIEKKNKEPFSLKANPFTPQDPVINPEKFAGRGQIILNAIDALFNHKNIIITGERGIGKSSVAYQLSYLAAGETELLNRLKINVGDYVFNYLIADHRCVPGNTLCDILNSWVSSTKIKLASLPGPSKKTTEFCFDFKFVKYIEKEEKKELEISDLVSQFLEFIRCIYTDGASSYNGVIFLLDEIDSLPQEIQLASFLKSATESLRFNRYPNVSFLLAGITGTITDLVTQHPSFARLCENIELMRMSNIELEEIIVNALRGTNIGIIDSTKKRIISLADRFPEPVQLLGYHTFKLDTDNLLDDDDLAMSLKFIIKELKRQEFTELHDRAGSGLAEPILRAMAHLSTNEFSVNEISNIIKSRESSTALVMGELASRGLLNKAGKGIYKFKDPLFKIYLKWTLI